MDLFMETVKGKYPISTNMGSAKNWLDKDGNPEPDCQLWMLKSLAFLPFGLDHFYLRSPLTAMPKLILGMGITGLIVARQIYRVPIDNLTFYASLSAAASWWLWDLAQIFSEGDRVLQYGMATPFDFYTGIGQGMITDKPTEYVTEASYPMWLFGIAFGFIGLDSLIAQNGGQMLRKATEFALFLWCVITIADSKNTSTGGWITALVFGLFLGTIIIAEYFAVAGIVFGGEPLRDGIKFTDKQDKQYNSFFSWLVKNTFLSDETKAKVIKDLAYGGISAEELKAMFEIKHKATLDPNAVKEPKEKEDGTWISYVIMLAAPFLIILNWIVIGCQAIYYAVFPAAAVMAAQSKATLKAMKIQAEMVEKAQAAASPAALAGGLGVPASPAALAAGLVPDLPGTPGALAGGLGVPTALPGPAGGLGVPASPAALAGGLVPGLPSTPGAPLPGLPGAPLPAPAAPLPAANAPAPKMSGGARKQELSLESQVMGASIAALIAGGALKGIVDYLISQ